MRPQPAKCCALPNSKTVFFHKKNLNPHNNCVFKLIPVLALRNYLHIPIPLFSFQQGYRNPCFVVIIQGVANALIMVLFIKIPPAIFQNGHSKPVGIEHLYMCAKQLKQLRFRPEKPISVNDIYHGRNAHKNNTYKITQHRCHFLTKAVVHKKLSESARIHTQVV